MKIAPAPTITLHPGHNSSIYTPAGLTKKAQPPAPPRTTLMIPGSRRGGWIHCSAGLLQHRLEVRLRGFQSIMVRREASLGVLRLAVPERPVLPSHFDQVDE